MPRTIVTDSRSTGLKIDQWTEDHAEGGLTGLACVVGLLIGMFASTGSVTQFVETGLFTAAVLYGLCKMYFELRKLRLALNEHARS